MASNDWYRFLRCKKRHWLGRSGQRTHKLFKFPPPRSKRGQVVLL